MQTVTSALSLEDKVEKHATGPQTAISLKAARLSIAVPRILSPDFGNSLHTFSSAPGYVYSEPNKVYYKHLKAYEQVRIAGAKRSTPRPW